MEYKVVEKDYSKYIMLDAKGKCIETEQDGLDIISICMENGINLLLIHGERLSDKFMQLRTGVAGAILQKFITYNIKAVVVLEENRIEGKFEEFLVESNRGNLFRAYMKEIDAERWLLSV